MQKAIKSFRERFSPDARNRLRVVMNETGLPKTVFNIDEPLSAPRSDQPDTIARDFLVDHPAMFGLDRNQILEMKLMNEDNDQGTTFLNYEQMIDGIPVFQGQVQVAINVGGQGISGNEGLVIPEPGIDTTPRLSEGGGGVVGWGGGGRVGGWRGWRTGQAKANAPFIETRSARVARIFSLR